MIPGISSILALVILSSTSTLGKLFQYIMFNIYVYNYVNGCFFKIYNIYTKWCDLQIARKLFAISAIGLFTDLASGNIP